ncbi:hypothetical protein [Microbacterium enclense]|uniref:hypothetical protein n=1 Tax=Microbacterium enclense TaxID=993073 RepID=UPI003F7CDEF3
MADPIPPRPGIGAMVDRMNAERQRTTRLERPGAGARTVPDSIRVDVLGTFDWMEPPRPTTTTVPLSTGHGFVTGGIHAQLIPGQPGSVTATVTFEVEDAAGKVVIAAGSFVDTITTSRGADVDLGFSHAITASGPAPYTVTLLISASATGTPGHVAFTAPHLMVLTT